MPVLLLALLLVGQVGRAEVPQRSPIYLRVGEQRIVSIPGLMRFSLGNPGLVRVLPPAMAARQGLGHENLLIRGVKRGRTDLWVRKSDGASEFRTIVVESAGRGLSQENRQLLEALGPLREVETIRVGRKIVLHGKIRTLEELRRVDAIQRDYADRVRVETRLDPVLLAEGEERLRHGLKQSRLDRSLQLSREGDRLVVRGELKNQKQRARIESLVRSFFPGVALDLQVLGSESKGTVFFRVYLLERQKSSERQLGWSWPTSVESALRVTPWKIEPGGSLELSLQAMENDGRLRILSRPELVVRVPGTAELFSGGEFPIHQKGRYFSNLNWKRFGLSLKLRVESMTTRRVRVDVQTEVSHLDDRTASESTPGIQSNHLNTQVDATFDEPLLLSGLYQGEREATETGVPVLKDIPLLGLIFGSQRKRMVATELVAVLLPKLKPPLPADRSKQLLPKGPLPKPRRPMSLENEIRMLESPTYPWSAFRGDD